MQFLDKYGWPVIIYENKPLLNFFRMLFYTRKIKRGTFSIVVFEKNENTQGEDVC